MMRRQSWFSMCSMCMRAAVAAKGKASLYRCICSHWSRVEGPCDSDIWARVGMARHEQASHVQARLKVAAIRSIRENCQHFSLQTVPRPLPPSPCSNLVMSACVQAALGLGFSEELFDHVRNCLTTCSPRNQHGRGSKGSWVPPPRHTPAPSHPRLEQRAELQLVLRRSMWHDLPMEWHDLLFPRP